ALGTTRRPRGNLRARRQPARRPTPGNPAGGGGLVSTAVLEHVRRHHRLALPAYVTDHAALASHAAAVRDALPASVELLYAAKANPDPAVLQTLRAHIDGVEVASGGE